MFFKFIFMWFIFRNKKHSLLRFRLTSSGQATFTGVIKNVNLFYAELIVLNTDARSRKLVSTGSWWISLQDISTYSWNSPKLKAARTQYIKQKNITDNQPILWFTKRKRFSGL